MQYLVIAVFLGALVSSVWAAEPTGGVSSMTTRLEIDARSGGIRSVVHSSAGRDLAGGMVALLYSIEFADPSVWVDSIEASSVRITPGTDGALSIETHHARPFAFTVTCRIQPERGTRFITGRIAVHSDQPCRIASVTFPTLRLALPLSGSGSDDAVVLPECDGVTMLDPLKNGLGRDVAYPGGASMQFLGAYDKSAGVYLASRDGEGYAKTLSAHRKDKALDLSIRHWLAQTLTSDWALPYDVALTTYDIGAVTDAGTGAGWEIAADLYRPWAIQQQWCRRTLAQRMASGDIPHWLSEPSLFYAFSLRGRLPDGKDGMRTALVPGQAEAWRQVVGGPVTFMLMNWEKHGPWIAPDYFPPTGDAAAFTAATSALHDKGHHAMVYLSGLNWTLHKTARNGYPAVDDQAAFDGRGKVNAISDPEGQPIIYGKPAEDVGQYARICPTTKLADEMLRGASLQCQDYGIDCVQADQLVGGGSPRCAHPEHQHPRGGGNWSTHMLYAGFARARESGRSRSADFAFSMEEPGEFFIPVLDTYHARDYMQNRWPRYGAGAVGVPLFTHVYHDYCLGYGGDSTGVSTKPDDVALYAQAMNLVCGKAPAVCVWTGWLDPATVDAAQKRLLRGHFDLWRGPAHDYLVFGRRVAAAPLAVPVMRITYTDWPSGDRNTLEVPSILSATYEIPGRKRARVLACIAHEPVTVALDGESVRLEPGEAAFGEVR